MPPVFVLWQALWYPSLSCSSAHPSPPPRPHVHLYRSCSGPYPEINSWTYIKVTHMPRVRLLCFYATGKKVVPLTCFFFFIFFFYGSASNFTSQNCDLNAQLGRGKSLCIGASKWSELLLLVVVFFFSSSSFSFFSFGSQCEPRLWALEEQINKKISQHQAALATNKM